MENCDQVCACKKERTWACVQICRHIPILCWCQVAYFKDALFHYQCWLVFSCILCPASVLCVFCYWTGLPLTLLLDYAFAAVYSLHSSACSWFWSCLCFCTWLDNCCWTPRLATMSLIQLHDTTECLPWLFSASIWAIRVGSCHKVFGSSDWQAMLPEVPP